MDAINPTVTAQVGDDQVALLLDADAMIQYRQTFGREIFADIQRMFEIGIQAQQAQSSGNHDNVPAVSEALEYIGNLLWAVLLDARPDITVKQARKLLPRVGSEPYIELSQAVMEAVTKGLPEVQERPTKAPGPTAVKARKK